MKKYQMPFGMGQETRKSLTVPGWISSLFFVFFVQVQLERQFVEPVL